MYLSSRFAQQHRDLGQPALHPEDPGAALRLAGMTGLML